MRPRDFSVDLRDQERLEKDLRLFARKALPFAVRYGLNRQAFGARKSWQKNAKQTFTLRNKRTTQQMQVDRARGLNLHDMHSVVGSPAEYMREQEFGATLHKTGRVGMGVALPSAAGQGRKGGKRKRLVRQKNRRVNIKVGPRPSWVQRLPGKKQRAAVTAKLARAAGSEFVYLDSIRKGIYRLGGGKRSPKFNLVWDLGKRSITKRAKPTLKPAIDVIRKRSSRIFIVAFKQQIKRQKLFGY